MQEENTAKRGNTTLILCAIIAVLAILLWFTNCSGKGDENTVIDTKEVKGSFPTVKGSQVQVNQLPDVGKVIGQKVSGQKSSKATPQDVENFKALYHLTQKQYDSLLVVNRRLDSLANSLYDKRLQQTLEACKFIEFKHELDNDTIHITLTGISRGVPQNLNLDYILKSRKDTIQLKQIWCRIFAGAEVGINKELNQGTYKLNLTIQNAKNDLLSASYQRILNQNFYLVGYSKALFTINKREKKKSAKQ